MLDGPRDRAAVVSPARRTEDVGLLEAGFREPRSKPIEREKVFGFACGSCCPLRCPLVLGRMPNRPPVNPADREAVPMKLGIRVGLSRCLLSLESVFQSQAQRLRGIHRGIYRCNTS